MHETIFRARAATLKHEGDLKLDTTVTIIGAGPYGVATAAHLCFLGIDLRIFGSPMRRWLSQMPKSMILKSEACASNLPDPTGHYTLRRYCDEKGIPYFDYGVPLSRELFAAYAVSFQKKLVPQVENVFVKNLKRVPSGFEICLDNGDTLRSAKVVVATGLDHMAYRPAELRHLPQELCTHSADHYDLDKLKGKEVAVIGGGQSALETAAILHDMGSCVRLIVRAPALVWNGLPSTNHRSLYQRLRRPRSGLGEGLKTWVYDRTPQLFHFLPRDTRISVAKTALGPAGAWWLKERFVGKVPTFLGCQIHAVEARGARVALRIDDRVGQQHEHVVDHVIASTGYRFHLQNIPFLFEELKSQIAHDRGVPRLSVNFESSVPGLYFTGLASAYSLGPAMRFLTGTDFAARSISSHVVRGRRGRRARVAPAQTCVEK